MVDTKKLQEAISKAKDASKDIKFSQTYDLIISLKDIDLKKPDQQVDFFDLLPNGRGKPVKVCGLVGPELEKEAGASLDKAIKQTEFADLAAKKADVKKLAAEYDFFVAQANVMPKVAQYFGRVFGPRGKMPNPKAGCVVPPKGSLGPVKDRLQKTVRVTAKTAPHVQLSVGTQDMEDEKIIENIQDVYKNLVSHLPQGENNIRRVSVKLTMSPLQRVA